MSVEGKFALKPIFSFLKRKFKQFLTIKKRPILIKQYFKARVLNQVNRILYSLFD